MMKINLLGKPSNPLVSKPDKEKAKKYWKVVGFIDPSIVLSDPPKPKKSQDPKRKITMCGCGKHPVNPKKDVYKQHNHWLAQQHPKTEHNFSKLQGMKSFNEK